MTRGQVLKLIGALSILLIVIIFIVAIGSCRGGSDTEEYRLDEETSRTYVQPPYAPAHSTHTA